jgi:hypothetical protein
VGRANSLASTCFDTGWPFGPVAKHKNRQSCSIDAPVWKSLKAIGDTNFPRGELPRNGPGLISEPEKAVRIALEFGGMPREELAEKGDIVSRERERGNQLVQSLGTGAYEPGFN